MINKFTRYSSLLLLVLSFNTHGQAATPIDLTKSQVEWLGKKVTGQHNGTLELKDGQVDIQKDMLKGGRFVFDMTSIKVLDLKEEKWRTKLENHLKNDDFFAADKFPEAIFEISKATRIKNVAPEAPNYRITGDLAIKGITHVVEFDARVDIGPKTSRAQGEIIVDRTRYGISYKSGKFFENIGNQAIYDDFTVSFDVVTR